MRAGKILHRAGKTLHRAGKTLHRAGKTLHRAGKTLHRAGKILHHAGKNPAYPACHAGFNLQNKRKFYINSLHFINYLIADIIAIKKQ